MKSDYIVVGDSVLTQGFVAGIPTRDNKVIRFSKTKRKEYKNYSVYDLTEFRVSERLFFPKNIQIDGKYQRVFLEKLSQEVSGVGIWKLNGKPSIFYLETESGIEALGDDFQQVLDRAFDNTDLLPLVAITNLNEISLTYLFKTANSLTRPRTFTKLFTLTPWVGYSNQSIEFLIPDTNIGIEVKGASPVFCLDGEVFLTFKRNLSLLAGLCWTQLDAQRYLDYTFNQIKFQSDIFVDYNLVQVPLRARYYLDVKPNSMRLYAEAGYTYAQASYDKLGVFQAEFERNRVTTTSKTFTLSDSFNGFTLGLGFEKYLSKHRGLVVGVRQARLTGDMAESIQGFNFHVGFKF